LGSGGPRELLARGVWLTAPFGLWTLVSAFTRHPLCFAVTRSILPHKVQVMDRLWETSAPFRRAWRRITITWGAVSLADSALRLAMAWTLPVAVVPALDTVLTVVTIAVLQPPTWFFLRRAGVWAELF